MTTEPFAPPSDVSALIDTLAAATPHPNDAGSEEALASARREIAARPLTYPLGSGQAEEIALVAGLRPAIRQLLSASDAAAAEARFARLGLVCVAAERPLGPTRGGVTVSPTSPDAVRIPLFVGRDRGYLEAACAAEIAQDDEGHLSLGRSLGYPRCCVEAFIAAAPPRRSARVLSGTLAATQGALEPLLNVLDLDVFHFVSWFPCSFACAHTKRYAAAVHALVSRRHPTFARAAVQALSAHRLVLTDGVQLSLSGACEGEGVRLDAVWPTARDRHPRSTLEPSETEAVARALVRLRKTSTLTVSRGRWVLDGREEDGPVEAALYRFDQRSDDSRGGAPSP